ncbi:MAG: substrate-binding domain-containing protein [Nocardioides sp.]
MSSMRIYGIAAAIGGVLLVSACGASEADTNNDDAAGPSVSSDEAVATAKSDLAEYLPLRSTYDAIAPVAGDTSSLTGKTVWIVPVGVANGPLAAQNAAAEDALSRLGIKVHICDGKFVPTTITSCLNQAATQGADGVVTTYINYSTAPNAFDNLVAQGIPVYLGGAGPDGGKTESTAELGFNDQTETLFLEQKLQMWATIVDSGGKGDVLYVQNDSGPLERTLNKEVDAFFKEACPDCSVTTVPYQISAIDKVSSAVSAALSSHPDIKYVISEFDDAQPYVISGLTAAGFASKVKFSSGNGSLSSLQLLESSPMPFFSAGLSMTYIGWQYTDGVVRMMLGEVPESGVGVVRGFDKENVADLDLSESAYDSIEWFGSDDFEQQFLKAWGVS